MTFETTYKPANPDILEKLVRRDYALGESIGCKLIKAKDNDNYLVQTEDKRFVLRVYRYQKHWLSRESDYLFELEWLTFLHSQGLAVSFPIRRRDGGLLGVLDAPEGPRYWALFSYAEGSPGLTQDQAWRFGESIAQIHVASNDFESKYPRFHADLTWLVDKSVQRLRDFLDNERQYIVDDVSEIAEPLRKAIESFPFTGDEYGIIGGDFHGNNQHFTKDNEVTHFDFDLCSYGWRAYDLAVFRSKKGRSNQLWDGVLSGYQSIRPLCEHEIKSIPVFVLLRHIWVMGSVTTYVEAPGLLESGLWERWYKELKMYERGEGKVGK